MKYYYPVIVNASGNGATDHDYIKRNYQYGIKVIIKGINPALAHGSEPLELKTLSTENRSIIEVSETVGQNIFPWTGNVYK